MTTSRKSLRMLGALLWIACIQYFVVQVVVASSYQGSFSLLHNTISDLGNTVCGDYSGRYVCSPQHGLMNASFIVLGLTQAIGAILLCKGMPKSRLRTAGFGAMVLAGIGTIVVGLFPENAAGPWHAVGAAMPFVIGNIGLLLLGMSLKLPRLARNLTAAAGAAALVALVLFMTHAYLGIGQGGMERVVAYPQTIWMIVYGAFLLRQK